MADTWAGVARDARRSASRLLADGHFRSCPSRACHAAYAGVTHRLAGTPGVTFPAGREGPNHPGGPGTGGIRRPVGTSRPNVARGRRAKLSERVGRLYTMPIDADNHPSVTIADCDARAAVSIMNTAFDWV